MKQLNWEAFKELKGHEKKSYFEKDGRVFHVIMAQQFDRQFLDEICQLATKIRKTAATRTGMKFLGSLLDDKRAILYFPQSSTRTLMSFISACQILGFRYSDIRDIATSSEMKGETAEDSVRTLSSYVDLIVMRHRNEGLAEKIAWLMNWIARPVPIVNGGSGRDQHPTQALLDIYTLHRSFENYGGIDGKSIAMVGDLLRGRTVRSLSYLLKEYKDVKIYFVAPQELRMADNLKDYLREKSVYFEESENLKEIIPLVDAIYMTRIQSEYDTDGESEKIDYSRFYFKIEYLKLLKPNAVILHPLPRRDEIPVEVDDSKHAMYWRQVRNGMWTRTALIAEIFRKDKEILNY